LVQEITRYFYCQPRPFNRGTKQLGSHNRKVLIEFIEELQSGHAQNILLQLGFLSDFAATSSHEKINYLHDFKFFKASWQETGRRCFQALPVSNAISIPLNSRLLTEWEISKNAILIEQLKNNSNLYAQLEALNLLSIRQGLEYDTSLITADEKICTVRDLLEEINERADDQHAWYILRRCAGLLGKYNLNS
jgi:phosphorylase kinase alpha/beta subunit